MPLNGECKVLRVRNTKGFDDAVGRRCLDAQALAQTVDALAVQRVYLDGAGPGDALKLAAWCQYDIVCRGVLDIERRSFVFTMIEASRHFFDVLMQCAAIGDVEFLKAAADGKDGRAALNDVADQR